MTITIEINNPHYKRTVEDMAAAVGIPVETLCAGMVEHAIDDYAANVASFKRNDVMWRLPDDIKRRIETAIPDEEGGANGI